MPRPAGPATQSARQRSSSALCALADVACRLGVETSVDQLQRSFVLSGIEPPSSQLIAIAREIGVEGTQVMLRWRDLSRVTKSLPAILRLTDGTSLILEKIETDTGSGTVAIVRDPTSPVDALVAADEARLGRHWSGEIILLKRRHALTDERQPFGLKWLFGQVLREKRLFTDIATGSVIATIFALAPPFMLMIVIDRVLTNHSLSTLNVLTGAILLLLAFETALGFLRRLFMQVITTRIDGRLNLYVLDRLLKLPMEYFEKNPTGMILSKVAQLSKIRTFLTGQLFGTFLDMVPLLGLVPVMLILDWRLSLMVFALTGVIFIIVVSYIKPLGRRYGEVVEAEQRRGAHLVETIYGMRTIKSLALEGRRRHEWDNRIADLMSRQYDLGTLANYPQTLSLPFERLIYSGTFLVGGYMVLSGSTTSPGVLVAFAMLSMRLASPLVQVARLLQDFAEVRGSIGQVASIMNELPEQSRAGAGLRQPIRGEISFDNVRFRYSSDAPYALDGVTFGAPRGKMLGIMGRSGSGKTTVTRLLQGLNPNYEGIIKVDGMDLREIDLNHLRTSIGVVPQENFLFSGSVRENIAMARPDASFADIVRAAQAAGAEEFIERMPRGYDTYLEEGAVNLSGGQRQRLAIARALLINPPVLVLDEATSALDAESEAIINANLQRIAKGRTVICISHRLSMLVPADAILVLERGRVYDIGSHGELLQRCDIYKHLWHTQNRYTERSTPHVQLAITRSPEK